MPSRRAQASFAAVVVGLLGLVFLYSDGARPRPEPEPTPPARRAALCISGQFRTFAETVQSLEGLRGAFPGGADVFLFINNGTDWTPENRSVLENTLRRVAPVAAAYYDQGAYEAAAPAPGPCHRDPIKDPLRHFSHHGPQFWGVGRCFGLVAERERATGARYAWAVRLRPDQNHTAEEVAAVARIVETHDPEAEARAWYRKKKQSDAFALMTRGAVEAYASVWDEFRAGKCAELGLTNLKDQHRLKEVCAPMGLNYRFGTECMLTAHLALRGNVTVTADDALAPKLVRREPRAPHVRIETAAQREERLAYKSALQAATALQTRLKALKYADDGAALAGLVAGLQQKLDASNRTRHGLDPAKAERHHGAPHCRFDAPCPLRDEAMAKGNWKRICRWAAGPLRAEHTREEWQRLCERAKLEKDQKLAAKKASKRQAKAVKKKKAIARRTA